MRVYLVQSVGECIVGTWGWSKHFPIIYAEFVPTWRRLALRDCLQCSDKLYGRLQVQCEGVISLGLSSGLSQLNQLRYE